MPLTPKGYCDLLIRKFTIQQFLRLAEMPLTPKGYCDVLLRKEDLLPQEHRQKCP